MRRTTLTGLAAVAIVATAACAAAATEEVGKAVSIGDTVTGDRGRLRIASPVHRDERIRTNFSGLGQFSFNDGTKLAVGPNASVVIDKYVLGEGGKLRRLTVKASKGALRWISGRSASNAYQIITPVGSLGVRGTAVDLFVAPNGDTMAVLLNGRARFCIDRTNCRDLTRQCQVVVARRQNISDPAQIDSRSASQLAAKEVAFPFLSGTKRLRAGFGSGSCGLNRRTATAPKSSRDGRPERASEPRGEPGGEPGEPGGPD
jgi:hypothetical protein